MEENMIVLRFDNASGKYKDFYFPLYLVGMYIIKNN
jgi:hypothetical protein